MNNIEIRAYRNTINFNLVTPNSAILTVGCSSLGDLSQTSRFRINDNVSVLMIRSIHFRTIDTLTLAEIQNEIHGQCDTLAASTGAIGRFGGSKKADFGPSTRQNQEKAQKGNH